MHEPLDALFIGAVYLSDILKTDFIIIGRKGSHEDSLLIVQCVFSQVKGHMNSLMLDETE